MRREVFVAAFGFLMMAVTLMPAFGAETVTVTGEIIDTYCFVLMGAKGESHRQCAIDCSKVKNYKRRIR